MKIKTKDDLLLNTRRVGNCLEWEGSHFNKTGNAFVLYRGEKLYVHRAMWLFEYGDIPYGAEVSRSCHNHRCIRPEHLVLNEGKAERLNGGVRAVHHKGPQGERQHLAKLTDEKVIEIRRRHAAGETQPDLARAYGVTQGAISSVVLGKTWKHVEGIQTTRRPRRNRAKLTEDQVREIRRRCDAGESFASIARDFPVNDWQISRIAHGHGWKNLITC